MLSQLGRHHNIPHTTEFIDPEPGRPRLELGGRRCLVSSETCLFGLQRTIFLPCPHGHPSMCTPRAQIFSSYKDASEIRLGPPDGLMLT